MKILMVDSGSFSTRATVRERAYQFGEYDTQVVLIGPRIMVQERVVHLDTTTIVEKRRVSQGNLKRK